MADTLFVSLKTSARRPSAFARAYELQAPLLLAFFMRRTFDVEVARDLTAETFAEAFEHRRRFRGRTDAEAEAWFYAIAKHQLGRYIRAGVVHRRAIARLGIELPEVSEEDHQRIVELAGLADLRRTVASAFSTLPPEQREALRLRIIDEQAYSDVAATLGVSEQAARARVSRGLRRISGMTGVSTQAEVNR